MDYRIMMRWLAMFLLAAMLAMPITITLNSEDSSAINASNSLKSLATLEADVQGSPSLTPLYPTPGSILYSKPTYFEARLDLGQPSASVTSVEFQMDVTWLEYGYVASNGTIRADLTTFWDWIGDPYAHG
ncbi:MAG: hypothetical protein LUO85_01835, partial [Methanomassiliicoccales archaeon]|nr:hypothetical protein [Methanomassiliicoccales archaeon]